MNDLGHAIAAFTAHLRGAHGFEVAQRETHDALRAAEIVGIASAGRLRGALRAIYCTSPEEVARFDPAFEAFFRGRRGVQQPQLPPARPGRPKPGAPRPRPKARAATEDDDERHTQRRAEDAATPAMRWQLLRARYSAAASRARPPQIAAEGLEAMQAAVDRLIGALRIPRARRRVAQPKGPFVDLRRTLRASVGTAGEPLVLARTGPSLRGARFVVLMDGSRSMAEHAAPVLQLAYALCRRTRRANAFVFSTALIEVTRTLRTRGRAGRALDDLGDAWGGGTRIGENLDRFIRSSAQLLSRESVVIIASDGLDVGALDRLARAMRELHARAAAVVWLNPHAGDAAFAPSAGGMRVALPYLTVLDALRTPNDLLRIARRTARALRR